MTTAAQRARPWLPDETLRSAGAARPIVDAIGAWSAAWFAGSGWRATGPFQPVAGDDRTPLREGGGSAVAGRPRATLDLAFSLLGTKPRSEVNDTDLRLLRRMAGKALDDLHARIEAALPSEPATGGPRWRIAIGHANASPLAVDLAQDALAKLARRGFAPVAGPVALAPARSSVMDQDVRCAAHLGQAALSVRDIAGLGIGDVIVLDQPVATPARLTIDGRPTARRCTVETGGTTLALLLQD